MGTFTRAFLTAATGFGLASAGAAPIVLDSFAEAGLQPDDGPRVEAALEAARAGWRVDLAEVGDAADGDLLDDTPPLILHGSFDFDLRFEADSGRLSWTVTGERRGWWDRNSDASRTLVMTLPDEANFSTLRLLTNGERGVVTLSDLVFDGLGTQLDSFPSLRLPALPSRPREATVYAPDGELVSSDWRLRGHVRFDSFTHWNNGEGARLELQLSGAQIPEPATVVLLALGAWGLRLRG